ncbi:MAG: hypothetical protein LBM98_06640 [Oscillospiraceae bacterium]|nr:hypothetical protein [Oscillospiraceae bacterium]
MRPLRRGGFPRRARRNPAPLSAKPSPRHCEAPVGLRYARCYRCEAIQ